MAKSRRFTYAELCMITNKFKKELGESRWKDQVSLSKWLIAYHQNMLRGQTNSGLYILTAGKIAFTDGGITEEVNEEFDKIECVVLIGSALGGMKVNDKI
ncbi:hypothetical protein Patl1_33885 [Pistacia atlantica]|uniref:Uncharacterized protein n=1 Tax=Pistacia atlantica TaxID=434234 RepID=A0ACC0ZSK2_9ROSI|nr:hypothetical protein Patl1_33885 [Pistacia atlantica]